MYESDERTLTFGHYDVLYKTGTGERLFISLSSVGDAKNDIMAFEWRKSLRQNIGDDSYIIIKDRTRSWFHSHEGFSDVIAFLKAFTIDNQVTYTLALGLSMGGYGALMISQHLKIDDVVAMSTIACVDEPGGFDGRYKHFLKDVVRSDNSDMIGKEVLTTNYLYLFAVDEVMDVLHADLLAAKAPNNARFFAYHGDHNTGITLGRQGKTQDFVNLIMDGGFTDDAAKKLGLYPVGTELISLLAQFHREKTEKGAHGLAQALPRNLIPAYAPASRHALRKIARYPLIASGRLLFPSELEPYLLSGWSNLEPTGFWSLGQDHKIGFHIVDGASTERVRVTLKFMALVTDRSPDQRVRVAVNDVLIMHQAIEAKHHHFDVCFELEAPQDVLISITTPDAVSPKALGLSKDARELAVFIKSIAIDRAGASLIR